MSRDSLDQKVASLEADVSNLNAAVGKLTDAVQRLSDRLMMSNSTNWSVLAAWAGVIISILGGLGYLALNPVRYTTMQMEHRFYDHQHLQGHPQMQMRVRALEKRVDTIENEQRNRTRRVYGK